MLVERCFLRSSFSSFPIRPVIKVTDISPTPPHLLHFTSRAAVETAGHAPPIAGRGMSPAKRDSLLSTLYISSHGDGGSRGLVIGRRPPPSFERPTGAWCCFRTRHVHFWVSLAPVGRLCCAGRGSRGPNRGEGPPPSPTANRERSFGVGVQKKTSVDASVSQCRKKTSGVRHTMHMHTERDWAGRRKSYPRYLVWTAHLAPCRPRAAPMRKRNAATRRVSRGKERWVPHSDAHASSRYCRRTTLGVFTPMFIWPAAAKCHTRSLTGWAIPRPVTYVTAAGMETAIRKVWKRRRMRPAWVGGGGGPHTSPNARGHADWLEPLRRGIETHTKRNSHAASILRGSGMSLRGSVL